MAPYPRIGIAGLGRQQRDMLVTLAERGPWTVGVGWTVAGPVRTLALLETLERRHLVSQADGYWRLTDQGLKIAARELKRRRAQQQPATIMGAP